MTPAEYGAIAEFARRRAGLVFAAGKEYLVESRLGPVLAEHGLASMTQLVAALNRPNSPLADAVIDALTTNETSFFRDRAPFAAFRDVIIPAAAQRGPVLRVWSAACATGQEPYSLSIQMDECAGPARRLGLEILATDISSRCVAIARAGRYSEFEVQRGLSRAQLLKYFERDGPAWRVGPRVRSPIRWGRFNLLDSPAEFGRFDAVFCRNVLIYFDATTRREVLRQIASVLVDGGHLVVGTAETVLGFADGFTSVAGAPGVYAKTAASSAGRKTAAQPA